MDQKVTNAQTPMKVLILGAYGLIGCGVAQRLIRDGHKCIGFGRDIEIGRRVLPQLSWISSDLRAMTEESNWLPFLTNIDLVVNCSGALQDGPDDELETVHHHAIAALANTCTAIGVKIIQISATGARSDASTAFLSSKARGDMAVQSSGAQHIIFRPGLVLARHSYGGSTMLRMLAAIPLIQPLAVPDAKIQTVALDDVAEAVSAGAAGCIPDGFVADLVEHETHSLREVVASVRRWLGFAPPKREVVIPDRITRLISKLADLLALLRWRSPLRTTALTVLREGVIGEPTDLTPFGVPPVKPLSQTLENMPARMEDRLFSRVALLTPIIIATLIIFWFLSGVIGFLRVSEAALLLENVGWPHQLAIASVLFWAVIDIGISMAFTYRPYAKRACWLAVIVSLFYLTATTLFLPTLWLDPLGPMIKVFPGIALALVARVALETR